jgi:hypothetical protein
VKHVKERTHLEHMGIEGKILRKQIFRIKEGRVWTGFMWFTIGISGGML